MLDKTHVGYDIMPAAVDFFATYETLGVRYVTNPRSKWMTREKKDGIHIFHYPDRTLYRSKPGINTASIQEESMDAYLDYSVLSHPEMYRKIGYRYVMISPPHMQFRKAPIRNEHLSLFADSGGFQIRQGVTEFVDPEVLVDFYNASTDIGIGLDVPMHPLLYDKYLARMSHVASMNNRYIKERLNKNVSLYDLNHGMDLRDRKTFMDVTMQYEPMDGIALAGTSSKARGEYGVAAHIINGIVGICYVLARSKGRYRTAHILGTTTPFYMFAFHLLTKGGFFPHITSDSSTYAQAAMMNTQLTSVPGQSVLYRNTLPKGNILYRSPCACPVCSMVSYTQHLFINARANMIHSLYHYAYLNDLTEDLADQVLKGTITDKALEAIIAPAQFNHRHFSGIMAFMRDLISSNFKEAHKKNADFLEPMARKGNQNSLFGGTRKHNAPHGDEPRTDRILKSYEDWHKQRKSFPAKTKVKK